MAPQNQAPPQGSDPQFNSAPASIARYSLSPFRFPDFACRFDAGGASWVLSIGRPSDGYFNPRQAG